MDTLSFCCVCGSTGTFEPTQNTPGVSEDLASSSDLYYCPFSSFYLNQHSCPWSCCVTGRVNSLTQEDGMQEWKCYYNQFSFIWLSFSGNVIPQKYGELSFFMFDLAWSVCCHREDKYQILLWNKILPLCWLVYCIICNGHTIKVNEMFLFSFSFVFFLGDKEVMILYKQELQCHNLNFKVCHLKVMEYAK